MPDAEIHMFYRTVDTDISGVNPHAPSYVNMLPGGAISAREAYKTAMYGTHSHQAGRTFGPFVLDCYGCLAPAALQVLKEIRDESLSLLGTSDPFRFSRSSFLAELSHQWQYDNARIVVQWMTLVRVLSRRFSLPRWPPFSRLPLQLHLPLLALPLARKGLSSNVNSN